MALFQSRQLSPQGPHTNFEGSLPSGGAPGSDRFPRSLTAAELRLARFDEIRRAFGSKPLTEGGQESEWIINRVRYKLTEYPRPCNDGSSFAISVCADAAVFSPAVIRYPLMIDGTVLGRIDIEHKQEGSIYSDWTVHTIQSLLKPGCEGEVDDILLRTAKKIERLAKAERARNQSDLGNAGLPQAPSEEAPPSPDVNHVIGKCRGIEYEAGSYDVVPSHSSTPWGWRGTRRNYGGQGYSVEDRGTGWAEVKKPSELHLHVTVAGKDHDVWVGRFFKNQFGRLTSRVREAIALSMPEDIALETRTGQKGRHYFAAAEPDLAAWGTRAARILETLRTGRRPNLEQ